MSEVAVLGVGMHPWGKWGKPFVEYGVAAARAALAQVCELTWQLKGQATGRQVEGATVGVTANQGLFGHGSSVIVAR